MEGAILANFGISTAAYAIHRFFTGLLAVLAVIGAASLAGCRQDATPTKTTAAGSGSTTSNRPVPKRIDLEKPTVRIETSLGTITLQLDGIRAPGTVRNFLNYANEGFYDNTLVHYVDAGKMIVAGGYSDGGQPKSGHTPIRNEAHNGLKNARGTIAMTRDPAQIDSATSQFFINLADAPQRDHADDTPDQYGYCVFGEVKEGLDVAEKISRSPTADHGGDLAQTPDPPVVIKAVRVVR
jgi:peptidyl-prolyl cis-trans isomerase A (cyclophilin A)/peptidyl-prolyl cis-trans isomerase B (cyclophilin B)